MLKKFALVILLLVLGLAPVKANEYHIDTGDVLDVYIPYLQPDLENPIAKSQFPQDHTDLMVNPEGRVTLPPIGDIDVRGLTLTEFKNLLTSKASFYLKQPEVYVALKAQRPFSVYVLGQVKYPGAYQVFNVSGSTGASIESKISLDNDSQQVLVPKVSSLIKKAGGLMPNADISNIQINNNSTHTTQHVDLLAMLLDGDVSQDVQLGPNDVISIPFTSKWIDNPDVRSSTLYDDKFRVRVIGYVNHPGGSSKDFIYLDKRNMTVLSALSVVNTNTDARVDEVLVLRKDPNNNDLHAITVNTFASDFPLMPDDTIVVGKRRWWARTRDTVNILSQLMFSGRNLNLIIDDIAP